MQIYHYSYIYSPTTASFSAYCWHFPPQTPLPFLLFFLSYFPSPLTLPHISLFITILPLSPTLYTLFKTQELLLILWLVSGIPLDPSEALFRRPITLFIYFL